ncbi:MAG: ATP-binding protein [archaeon]
MKSHILYKVIAILVISVIAMMVIEGVFSYLSEKNKAIAGMNKNADLSVERLSNSLIYPLWNINYPEIEKSMIFEMISPDVKAILLFNYNGKFLIGKSKDSNQEIKKIELDAKTQDELDKSFLTRTKSITKENELKENEVIGSVTIYYTDFFMNKYLKTEILKILVQIIVVSTAIIFILFISLRQMILLPLLNLEKIVKQFRNNDFSARVQNISDDEIGELYFSFNKMLDQLISSKKVIENHNRELENKIANRTNELDNRVKELENTKKATLNILEDIDNTNKELISAKEELGNKVKELEVMDRKKDEFLSVTAHELKTPLTSIKGFADLLNNEKIMENKELRKKYFGIIIEDTIRLERLITDILDLSRLDVGTMKFNFEKTTVDELFTELINLSTVSIKKKGLIPIFKAQKGIPCFYADKSRLIQVLSNLINNAIKYTEKGYIKIEAKLTDKKNIEFSVTDTGIGIVKDEFSHLFERFYQIDSSYTRKVGGSGLGLAISKGIIQALGGKIWLESKPGKGSKFIFVLPIMEKEGVEKVDMLKDKNENIAKDNTN